MGNCIRMTLGATSITSSEAGSCSCLGGRGLVGVGLGAPLESPDARLSAVTSEPYRTTATAGERVKNKRTEPTGATVATLRALRPPRSRLDLRGAEPPPALPPEGRQPDQQEYWPRVDRFD